MNSDSDRKIFVGGLPQSAQDGTLRGLFLEAGVKVSDISMPVDRATGRPKGFAFVVLAQGEDRDAACRKLQGRVLEGRGVTVRPYADDAPAGGAPRRERSAGGDRGYGGGYGGGDRGPRRESGFGDGGAGGRGFDRPRSPRPDDNDRKLYIGNLPHGVTEGEVRDAFGDLGVEEVERLHLPVDETGRFRGFAFATFTGPDAASAAIGRLQGASAGGRRLVVDRARQNPSKMGR